MVFAYLLVQLLVLILWLFNGKKEKFRTPLEGFMVVICIFNIRGLIGGELKTALFWVISLLTAVLLLILCSVAYKFLKNKVEEAH